MRASITLVIAILALAIPAQAATVQVEVNGSVEWNFVRSGELSNVKVGDPVTMYFEVDSNDFTNSPNFPVRGYAIDMMSYSLTLGSVTVGLLDPYYPGRTPNFTIRDNDPVADGFFVSDTNIDYPFPGLPLEESGFCGPFESHHDVSYTGDTLTSLDILDALGTYDYDGLTRFYFNVVDCGFEAIGLIFEKQTISLKPVEVPVDVKPGSCPNPINAKGRGLTSVSILGTEMLDVDTIDPVSVRLDGIAPIRSSYDDVGTPFMPFVGKEECDLDCNYLYGDGWMDLSLKFDTQELIDAFGVVMDRECLVVELTGSLKEEYGGVPIVGEDVVLILHPPGPVQTLGTTTTGDRLHAAPTPSRPLQW